MEKKTFTLAVIGCGPFANWFMPLFKAHPNVKKIYVCDLIESKAKDFEKRFGLEIIGTYEEVLERKDIDCVLNFTQRHLHGSIVKRALLAGKHVFSAVPMASTVKECEEIVELVKKTGLIYMMAETCYYYPCAMYCREAYEQGKFGKFVYGASQYYHDIDSIGYGKTKNEAGMPPLLYPTHSTSMILSAVGSFVKKVTCVGYKDTENDGRFGKGNNYWDNEYSNQYVFMELENGGVARVTEARRIGWRKPSSYISALYGTNGGYEFSNAQHILVERDYKYGEEEHVKFQEVSDYVNLTEMTEHKNDVDFKEKVANGEWQWNGNAPVQKKEVERLPEEFKAFPNGHMGSHKLLVDDFLRAVRENKQPVLNAWKAARYTVPGLVAIESLKQGGIPLEVPDFGDYDK
jgi:predicted dehydrogenase